MSFISSITPIMNTREAPNNIAINSGEKIPFTKMASKKARKTAPPPSKGVASPCLFLSSGMSMAPILGAIHLKTGVRQKEKENESAHI